MSAMRIAIIRDRIPRRLRAYWFGWKPSSATAAITRARVSGLIWMPLSDGERTRDTVLWVTPAACATACIVTLRPAILDEPSRDLPNARNRMRDRRGRQFLPVGARQRSGTLVRPEGAG